MKINNEKLAIIKQKFISDPDWSIIEEILTQRIQELDRLSSIDTKGKTADEVFAEVKGRQIIIHEERMFLEQMGLLKPRTASQAPRFN